MACPNRALLSRLHNVSGNATIVVVSADSIVLVGDSQGFSWFQMRHRVFGRDLQPAPSWQICYLNSITIMAAEKGLTVGVKQLFGVELITCTYLISERHMRSGPSCATPKSYLLPF